MPGNIQEATLEECDLLIRNASVIDGTGGPIRKADVAVSGDEIVGVGLLNGIPAQAEIDSTGLCLAPGFIDAHTHDDWGRCCAPRICRSR